MYVHVHIIHKYYMYVHLCRHAKALNQILDGRGDKWEGGGGGGGGGGGEGERGGRSEGEEGEGEGEAEGREEGEREEECFSR